MSWRPKGDELHAAVKGEPYEGRAINGNPYLRVNLAPGGVAYCYLTRLFEGIRQAAECAGTRVRFKIGWSKHHPAGKDPYLLIEDVDAVQLAERRGR